MASLVRSPQDKPSSIWCCLTTMYILGCTSYRSIGGSSPVWWPRLSGEHLARPTYPPCINLPAVRLDICLPGITGNGEVNPGPAPGTASEMTALHQQARAMPFWAVYSQSQRRCGGAGSPRLPCFRAMGGPWPWHQGGIPDARDAQYGK